MHGKRRWIVYRLSPFEPTVRCTDAIPRAGHPHSRARRVRNVVPSRRQLPNVRSGWRGSRPRRAVSRSWRESAGALAIFA